VRCYRATNRCDSVASILNFKYYKLSELEMVGKTKILFVDDSRDISELYHVAFDSEEDLESLGYLLSADSLVEEVSARKPDVVVLDLTMPGKDPLEALSEVSEKFSEVKVITFSGYSDPKTVSRSIEAGAVCHVSKDSDLDEMLKTIRDVVSGNLGAGK